MRNWYIAKIVFGITAQNTEHKPQFDEQIRLILADSHEEALLKARIIGLNEEDSFINDRKNLVKWEFINVSDLTLLEKLDDGVELSSRIYEMEDASEHVHYVHQKAITLRLNSRPIY
jgi:hypothetical protein